ncbi:uncharacterized protein TNCT_576291 [Trichonephila clavata]|uniref:Uncharacterized protein n=1 Tax=Trichonephila clavata TaxID=2740835 RepID=A0A8X6GUC2_TRICU|nr:uncharacterized protein TNCT_576291 [Trichonephila clavata]
MNDFTEALLFTEDLLVDYMKRAGLFWSPCTSGNTYRSRVLSKFTKDIGAAVYNFSLIQEGEVFYTYDIQGHSYPNQNFFPDGYSPLDFLEYCSKLASCALSIVIDGNEEFGDSTTLTITKILASFMRTGEFARAGGWSSLQDMGRRCTSLHVIQTLKGISIKARCL